MPTARSLALEVLERVFFGGAYSHIALSNAIVEADLSERDRGLTTELVYGTLARKRTLDELLSRYVNRSLDGLDRPVLLSLRLAAYQLLFLDRIPPHAAVNESVELTKARCGRGAGGFTNGVLRSLLRDKGNWNVWEDIDPDKEPVRHLGVRHSLPDWIAALLVEQHDFDEAMRRAESFSARPPLYFRAVGEVPEELAEKLEAVDDVPGCLRAEAMTPELLDAVETHKLVVQDLGSQLVGHFCAPDDSSKILDCCAGLGGKTLHLAHLAGAEVRVIAVDPQKSKLDQLAAIAEDISFGDRIETIDGELGDLAAEHTDFDLVLVDAPCSGLGVIRRHPETRWRRTKKDVEDLAALQKELLEQAAGRLRPGGLLVYSVCTFTEQEGPRQVENFLAAHDDFERAAPPSTDHIDWSKFTDDDGDMRLNPADHDADAFYAARLQSTSKTQ